MTLEGHVLALNEWTIRTSLTYHNVMLLTDLSDYCQSMPYTAVLFCLLHKILVPLAWI